ncbi:MAG TPA: TrkA C-terminal domain-containing protein [Vicinamibacterales bacterium]|nr:TrkA C-terminal domain-containing protein [Vicinamibacterales bacterium]
MRAIFHFLETQPFFLIFGVVALGMVLGKRTIRGISFGSVVCIIFVGLIVAIWAYSGYRITLSLPDVLKTIFFNLFIFAIGVKIGPQFFSGLERDGWHLVAIGAIVAVLAPVLSVLCGWFFDLPQGAVAGLLAGANNSSATFGAASSALQSGAVQPRAGSSLELVTGTLSAAFALCYTVSQVQFVLFMKVLPALGHFDAPEAARTFLAAMRGQRSSPLPGTVEASEVADTSVTVRAYRVPANAIAGRTLAGHTIGELRSAAPRISIERVRRADRWLSPSNSTTLEVGDEVVVESPIEAQVRVRAALGPELPDVEARSLAPIRTVDVVVGRPEVAGHSVSELTSVLGPGLYPNAVFRAGEELPATAETIVKIGDVIRVTGTEAHIANLGAKVGHVVRATHSTDILTLAIGLLVGAALGAIPVPLFGVHISFGAAAVLVTGIIFGWLRTRHPALGGPISEGGRSLMEELGLNVFTSVLAINSGQAVYQVITQGPVWALVVSCLIVSAVPALVAWWIGRHTLRLNEALLMGAIAGARQNTSSMRAAQKETESAVPGIGYPVPLAITTVALSIVAYFFTIFS